RIGPRRECPDMRPAPRAAARLLMLVVRQLPIVTWAGLELVRRLHRGPGPSLLSPRTRSGEIPLLWRPPHFNPSATRYRLAPPISPNHAWSTFTRAVRRSIPSHRAVS